MKHLMIVALTVMLGGCVTTRQPAPPLTQFGTAETLQKAEAFYQSVDVASATPVETFLIGYDWDRSVAKRNCQDFPWLNPRNLSAKDKLFILRMKNGQEPVFSQLQPLMGQP